MTEDGTVTGEEARGEVTEVGTGIGIGGDVTGVGLDTGLDAGVGLRVGAVDVGFDPNPDPNAGIGAGDPNADPEPNADLEPNVGIDAAAAAGAGADAGKSAEPEPLSTSSLSASLPSLPNENDAASCAKSGGAEAGLGGTPKVERSGGVPGRLSERLFVRGVGANSSGISTTLVTPWMAVVSSSEGSSVWTVVANGELLVGRVLVLPSPKGDEGGGSEELRSGETFTAG